MIGAMIVKSKVRSSFDVIGQHNLDKFMASWSDNATLIYPNNLSVGGEIKGKEAIKEWYRKDWEQFPVMSYDVKNVCIQNIFALGGTNVATVEWAVKGRNKNMEEFSNSGVSIIHIRKGKVTMMRIYIFDLEVAKRVWCD